MAMPGRRGLRHTRLHLRCVALTERFAAAVPTRVLRTALGGFRYDWPSQTIPDLLERWSRVVLLCGEIWIINAMHSTLVTSVNFSYTVARGGKASALCRAPVDG